MSKRPQLLFGLFVFSCLWCHVCLAQDHYFATLHNIKPRPLAMGGAFTSVEDDLEAIAYNPATFSLYKDKKDHRITLYFNPIASWVALKKYSNNFQQKIDKINLLEASALLFKAIVFTGKFVNTGIIFGEESLKNIYNYHSSTWFNFNDLWDNCSNTFFASFKLAERLSIGVSGSLYHERNSNNILKQGIGFSYGIMLKPSSRLCVGLAYMDFAKNMSDYRMLIERMDDETMNIGVSYYPTSSTIFSLDIRNLTEENKENVRELHVGFEQSIYEIGAIRLGFFRERFVPCNNYSIGIGILDSNLIFKNKNRLNHHDFTINYSFIYQENLQKFNRWHFFSLLFRI